MRQVSGDFNMKLFSAQSSDQSWLFNDDKRNITYDIWIPRNKLESVKDLIVDDFSDLDDYGDYVKIIVDETKFAEVEKILGSDYSISAYNYAFNGLESLNINLLREKMKYVFDELDILLDLSNNFVDCESIFPSLSSTADLGLVADIGLGLEVYHQLKAKQECFIAIEI